MKEVLTKKFWQDVKKTFDEARAEPPPENVDPEILPECNAKERPATGIPAAPEGSSNG